MSNKHPNIGQTDKEFEAELEDLHSVRKDRLSDPQVLDFLVEMQRQVARTLEHVTGYKVRVHFGVYDGDQDTGKLFTAACRTGWAEHAKDGHVWANDPIGEAGVDGIAIHHHLISEDNNA